MKITSVIALILTIIGGLNWLIIGLTDFNLVYFITMENLTISRVIYSLVGLSALWMTFYSFIYKPFNKAK